MKSVVIGTAGHIDHGKSALVRALTGTDPDRLKEEQARGITIDLGFAQFTHDDSLIALVDVPGHERFVRNMLAGAGGIDAVLLVVDANEGVRPQTREHFEICRLLGLDRGVIALTKVDVADRDAVARARSGAAALVAGTFLDGAPIVTVSAKTGAGLDELKARLAGLAGGLARLEREGLVRLPIDRAFTIKGFGAVVTGTLVSGRVSEGETLAVLPERTLSRVRSLQVHGSRVPSVQAPHRAAVNLADIETRDLRRGQTLATPGTLSIAVRADVRLELLRDVRPLRHGARVRVHATSCEAGARISIAATRGAHGDWRAVRPGQAEVEVEGGGAAFARVTFAAPVPMTRGDRLIVRCGSPLTTVAGAVVLDPEPPATGVRRESTLARFETLSGEPPPTDLVIREAGDIGISASDLVRRCGLGSAHASREIEDAVAQGMAVRVADRVIDATLVARRENAVLAMLENFHRQHPLDAGLSPGAVRDGIGHPAADVVAMVLARLANRGLVRGNDRIALTSHAPTVPAGELELHGRLERLLRDGRLSPPDIGACAPLLGATSSDVDRAAQWLLREKRLVRTGGLVFHADVLGELKTAVRALRDGQAASARVTLDVPSFKARFGLTRKHAIPLLEWLDREHVTRRIGDVRIVL